MKVFLENFITFVLFAYAAFLIYVAYMGFDFHLGVIWALVLVASAFAFHSSIPVLIGVFFGASDVWGWHWSLAILFAFSGLMFLVPTFLLFLIEGLKR